MTSVETFVDVFIAIYALVIFVYIIVSWLRLPYSPDAQPDPALPLRRCGAVPAALPSHPAVVGPARLLADLASDRARRDRPLAHLDPRPLPLKGRPMALTPVEIRHLTPPRTLLRLQGRGNRRAARGDRDELRGRLARARRPRRQGRAARGRPRSLPRARDASCATTLVSAEQASAEMKEQARREAELILSEAHAEARAIQRRAIAENERLVAESRRLRVAAARRRSPRSRTSPSGADGSRGGGRSGGDGRPARRLVRLGPTRAAA